MNQSSLYIHPDNQTILWNLINKSPLFSNVQNKEEWFRTIISQFHEQMISANHVPKTKEDLLNVNKQTLKYMVSQLNEKYGNQMGFLPFQQGGGGNIAGEYNTQLANRNYEVYNPNELKQKKVEADNAQFNKFEAEYHSMLKPIPPLTIDFSQPVNDGKIGNMEDAIKQHEKMREMDIAKYIPPPPIKNAEESLKEKIQGISANTMGEGSSGLFSEPKYPKQLIISPPSSDNWTSFTSPTQENYVSYTR